MIWRPVDHLLPNGPMSKPKNYQLEYRAFAAFVQGKRIPLQSLFVLSAKSALMIFEMCIRYIPGGFGYALRYWYYKLMLKKLGKNVLIDVGVFIYGTKNISIGDFTWIDGGVRWKAIL